MMLIHRCGWKGIPSELKVEKFVYSGIETITYTCPNCDERCQLFDDECYVDEFDEYCSKEDEEIDYRCPIKSSNRKNSKPVQKIKPQGEFNEH